MVPYFTRKEDDLMFPRGNQAINELVGHLYNVVSYEDPMMTWEVERFRKTYARDRQWQS
jgi:hypothetical protein